MLNGADPAPDLPEPFSPPDCDVSMLSDFRLNVDKLLASELVAVSKPDECWYALMLWCRAWKQVPGGSLPNDERALASFSGAGRRWKKVRQAALRGFVLCSDGRLYHRVVCEEAMRACSSHRSTMQRREAEKKRIAAWREKRVQNDAETPDVTRSVSRETVPLPSVTGPDLTVSKTSSLRSEATPTALATDRVRAAPSARFASLIEEGGDILGKRHKSLVAMMLKRAGEERVRYALREVEDKAPSSPAGFFRSLCETDTEPETVVHDKPPRPLTPEEVEAFVSRINAETAALQKPH